VLARFGAIPALDNVRLTASARIEPAAPQPGQKVLKAKKQRTVVTFTIAADLGSGTP